MNAFLRDHKKTLLLFAAVAALYVLLHQKYYLYYIDDAWFVSEIRHYMQTGKLEDVLFRQETAPDRVLLFGESYFWIYGTFMEAFGWSKSNAILLSKLFMLLSAFIWWKIAGGLSLSKEASFVTAAGVLLLPAFFNAASLTRPDAYVFFVASVSFLAFIRQRYFAAGVLLVLAVEGHLMGSSAAFFMLAHVAGNRSTYLSRKWKLAIDAFWCLAGGITGLAIYYFLHPDFTFERFFTILSIKKEMNGLNFGYIVKYFNQTYWFRHVWELPFIIGSIVLAVRQKLWKQQFMIPALLIFAILSSFVTSRPNANYMVFIYPAFLVFAVWVFEQTGYLKRVVSAVCVILALLYGGHFAVNMSYDFDAVNARTEAAIPDDDLPVIGMPDTWFAAIDREFYPIYHSVTWIPERNPEQFYLIRSDFLSSKSRNYQELIKWMDETYDVREIDRFKAWKNNEMAVFHCVRKPVTPEGQ